MKYFEDIIEYPQDICSRILPWGERWDYVSSTFLTGFINYCQPIKAYTLNSYRSQEDMVGSGLKKKTLVDMLIKDPPKNTEISDFCDDVVILARIKEGEYMFFWYDFDVSDCSIGRFKTTDQEKEVVEEFERYISQDITITSRDVPVSTFRGWITW